MKLFLAVVITIALLATSAVTVYASPKIEAYPTVTDTGNAPGTAILYQYNAYIISPTADSVFSGTWTITPGSPATRWDKVDEGVTHNDADYITCTSTAGGYFIFNFAPISLPSGAIIKNIGIKYRARKATAGAANVRIAIRYNGNVLSTFDSGNDPGTAFTDYVYNAKVNPAKGSNWTAADIALLQGIGIASSDSSPNVSFSNVYAYITYAIPFVSKLPESALTDNSYGICAVCGQQLQPEYINDEATGKQILNEEQAKIWIHNPTNLHEDIQITVHQSCATIASSLYPNYDKPTQADWTAPKWVTIDADGVVAQKALTHSLIDPVGSAKRALADPVYIACGNGNWSSAATWATVDSTSYLDSEAGYTEIGTSWTYAVIGSAFTPGAITIDGIAVKLASRTATPSSYTVSVELYDHTATADVVATQVTINVSQLPSCTSAQNEGGWVFFKFGGNVTLVAGHAYVVAAKESNTSADVYLYTNATTSNWSRMLRKTTNDSGAAPVAADILHIMGEYVSGSVTTRTVTMDLTAATDFGSGTDASVALTVNSNGTLNYGNSAATNYYLKLSGNAIVYNGGTFTIGTVANPIPRDSTAVLEFDPVADGGMGLIARNGSTVTMQGLSRVAGQIGWNTKLSTTTAHTDTDIHLTDTIYWLDNDEIAIASTSRTYSECEKLTINGDYSGGSNNPNVDGTHVEYVHNGTVLNNGLGQAEVILLTRNVKVRSATSTIMTYFSNKPTAIVDIDWVEFYYMGEAATDKYGINIETTTGSFNMQYSSLHDCEDAGWYLTGTSGNNVTVSNCCAYNVCSATATGIVKLNSATSGTSITFSSNILMLASTASNYGFYLGAIGGTFTSNTVAGINGTGFYYSESHGSMGTFTNNVAHSNASYGHRFVQTPLSGNNISISAWRNNAAGFQTGAAIYNVKFTGTLFGNSGNNFTLSAEVYNVTFSGIISDSDTSYSTTTGLEMNIQNSIYEFTFDNCNFSSNVAHTRDIYVSQRYTLIKANLVNTILNSGTEIASLSTYGRQGSYIRSQNHDQDTSKQYVFFPAGQSEVDTVVFHTASPSVKFTPNSSTTALTTTDTDLKWLIPCTPNQSVTVTIWSMWTSTAAPATLPSITLSGCGVSQTATMTAATGVWEQLTVTGTPTVALTPATGGMLEMTVSMVKSANATTVNMDDIAITYGDGTSYKNTGGLDFFFNGFPACYKVNQVQYYINKIAAVLTTAINKVLSIDLSRIWKIGGIQTTK